MKKRLQRPLTVFILACCTLRVFCQNHTIDSLQLKLRTQVEDTNKVNTLLSIARQLQVIGEYERSLEYTGPALTLSKKLNFIPGEISSLISTGLSNIYLKKNAEALTTLSTSLKIAEQYNNKELISDANYFLAQAYLQQENYPEAIKQLFVCLKLDEESGDKKGAAFNLMSIGYAYQKQSNFTEGLKSHNEALSIFKEVNYDNGIAKANIYLGSIYVELNQYPAALEADSTALKLFQRLNDKNGMGQAIATIGTIFEKEGKLLRQAGDEANALKKFTAARENYLQAQKLFEEVNSLEISWGYHNLGNINIQLQNYPEAKHYLEKALAIDMNDRWNEGVKENYLSLSILDSALQDYKQAYKHYKLYTLYRDSVINEGTATKLAQAKMTYEFEKKEALVKAVQDKKDAEAKRTRNFQYTVIGLILMLAIFLFWNNRQKQRSKAKIEKAYSELKSTQAQLIQSEKMASLGELTAGIAHEIQNPLNFVNNFSEVSSELLDEMKQVIDKGDMEEVKSIAGDVKQNLEKILHHGKRADGIVKGMLQHSRFSSGQKELTDINILADEYLRLAYHGLRAKDKTFNAAMETGYDDNIGLINIIPQDIGRVILNLITNAFYAVSEKKRQQAEGYEPIVSVSTKKVNGKIEIKVSDNGNGIPEKILDKIFQPFFTTKPTGQGTGLGLSLSYDIVTKGHGGELKVETAERKGTTFIISLPVNHN